MYYNAIRCYIGWQRIMIATSKSEWMHEYVSNHFWRAHICFHTGWRVVSIGLRIVHLEFWQERGAVNTVEKLYAIVQILL